MNIPRSETKTSIELTLIEMTMHTDLLVSRLARETILLVQQEEITITQAIKQILQGLEESAAWESFTKNLNNTIRTLENNHVGNPQEIYAEHHPKKLFDWKLGIVKTSHCPDCKRLSRQPPHTVKGWKAFGKGLPREGLTVCNVGCQCMLREVPQVK